MRQKRKYRVFNLDWEKVLSFCSHILLLNDLELIFLCSTMFDVFSDRLSVCPSDFIDDGTYVAFWSIRLSVGIISSLMRVR